MIFKDMINFYHSLFYHLHFLPNVIRQKINVDKKSRLPKCFGRKVVHPVKRQKPPSLCCYVTPGFFQPLNFSVGSWTLASEISQLVRTFINLAVDWPIPYRYVIFILK